MTPPLRDVASSLVLTGLQDGDLERGGLARYPFGGFVFFDRNAPTLAALRGLTDRIRKRYSDLAPILAIDQEGGRVMRLREGVAPMPSAAVLGRANDAALAASTGTRCAFDLRRGGCNLDLAPVIDLALDENNAVIGDRSFGAQPALVLEMARAFSSGLENGGVVATYKHFPGHGATAVDSHEALPVIAVPEATLRERDFVPFAALAPRAHAFMTAHVVIEALDSERPATLSHRILTRLLRDEMHFRGVCFTDCMQMGAVAKGVGSVEGALLAILAGADAVTVSHDPLLAAEVVERIVRAVENREIPAERLNEAAARVAALRRRLARPLPI
ncbi:MAG: beta-N-acetylhexosaminidase [Candidatus Tyrphobacter sp.]